MNEMIRLGTCLSIVIAIAALISAPCTAQLSSLDCEITSRSYMSVRPLFQSNDPILVSGFREERTDLRERDECLGGAMQVALFGGRTTSHESFARYFMPFCKTRLRVAEQIGVPGQDLLAEHFNIYTMRGTFESTFSFNPEQTVIGLGVHYRQTFWRSEEKGRGFWFSVSSPLTRINNTLGLHETIADNGGGPNEDADVGGTVVGSMTAAFVQQDFIFGKVDTVARSDTRLADIELKLGYEWLDRDPYHLESYIGVLIPTGTRVTSDILFQPIVGNGHHGAAMFGSAAGFRIWHDEVCDQSIRIEYNLHSNYLFQNKQTRSIDLNNNPWSRYIQLYADAAQAEQAFTLVNSNAVGSVLYNQGVNLATPGVNILTRRVKVTPGFSFNLNTAFVYTNAHGTHLEGGYNFYARRGEQVELADPWVPGPAIKHRLGGGRTNPVRTMTGNALLETITPVPFTQYDSSVITADQLDLASAAHPASFSHMIYGAAGYTWLDWEYPLFVLVGGLYELATSANNAVPERWVFWGKMGVSF